MKQNKMQFVNAFNYKVIYVFTVNDDSHKGLVKIGDATLYTESTLDKLSPNCHELNQVALNRIKSYTNTVGVTPELLHTELAIKSNKKEDGSIQLEAFRDYDVHRVLENSGIKKVKIGNTTGREWYRIIKDTAVEAIKAVKNNCENLSNTLSTNFTPIIFRPEQKEAIELTIKQFKKSNRMLWNAKMRFGKTLSALEVIRKCGYHKTIILTHRPVVNDGWYEDFSKIFHGTDYIYGSKSNGYNIEKLLNKGNSFVYFASIQDLRGSAIIGGKFSKNNDIFDTIWDCVIVDEAHEGTKTILGDETLKAIVKEEKGQTKLLALSGTPFNIMDEYNDDSIYTWDYIMEQECKHEWDKQHFGDSNPYEELPELRIYTYDLGDLLHNNNYITYEDKAFNFQEFFRTWTGEYKNDYAQMPQEANIGDFVHEQDVQSFLNLMTKTDNNNSYPYSKEEYRELFKHSLWMIPGVREAKALKKLMLEHPVFGSGKFNIVNVAGSDDEESADALNSVKTAIKNAEKLDMYTITLSCGKLTTGVTIKEWTAVFMISGSFSTSASNYLQTIFRVQSPCNKNGKIKTTGYVFDFAPDRTLKMISEAVSVSTKAGKTKSDDKRVLGKFLNYCPVISVDGSQMKEYKADKLLQQLKRAYADKVVRNGFDDNNLYNDELLKLQDVDIKKFDELKGIIGKSKASSKQNNITINEQGLTNEEYEELEKLSKKRKKELSEEEKVKIEELKKKKKVRNDAISILRGISIRMPLLIYGADIPYEEKITLDKFVEIIDDSSWDEFMPNGVTKKVFNEFRKYYDEDIFVAAGRRIRNIAREADTLNPTERVKKIALLFSNFKNPDKETVLTPWRVVNMHMSDCLGGYSFYNENYENMVDEPRFINQGQVTSDTLTNINSNILEINSKTGLYPLYLAYSIYRTKCKKYNEDELDFELQRKIWNDTIQNNIYVICKTPMAKQITRRTLVGYSDIKINAHYFDNLINQLKNKPQQFLERILKSSYWKKGDTNQMKFDAIVGNPPYQENDGAGGGSAKPVYQHFVEMSKKLKPNYLSFIMPARWYAGGKGLDSFRDNMLSENSIHKIVDYPVSNECFKGVEIKGGVCYILIGKEPCEFCEVTNVRSGVRSSMHRKLLEDNMSTFVRFNESISILRKVSKFNEKKFDELVSSRKPFGLGTDVKGDKSDKMHLNNCLKLYANKEVSQISIKKVKQNIEWISLYKVYISYAYGAGEDFPHQIINKPFLGEPGSICTETYLVINPSESKEEVMNVISYMKTKFFRFMVLYLKTTQHATKAVYSLVPIQDFSKRWTDEELYKKYEFNNEEINFIENMVKPMQ